jgi:hypothetical protein
MVELLSVTTSKRKDKRLTAKFKVGGRTESVSFGLKGGKTYVDGRTWAEREAYLARHRPREDFGNPLTAGSLASHILWGKHDTITQNVFAFKKRFKL